MDITAEKRKINELFPIENSTLRTKYVIPLYQREYSWSKDNVEELLGDVNNEEEGYYIGNLLVRSGSKNELELEIIDGQQRLTTIALTMIAIRDSLNNKKINNEKLIVLQDLDIQGGSLDYKEVINKLKKSVKDRDKKGILRILNMEVPEKINDNDIFNNVIARKIIKLDKNVRKVYDLKKDVDLQSIERLEDEEKEIIVKDTMDIDRQLKIKRKEDKEESVLKPLAEDQVIYNSYLGLNEKKIDKRKLMVKRFKVINDKLNEMCKTVGELDEFYNKLMAISILKIKMTNLSDAFNVFSSLNGKGLPLTLLDLLKSEYLKINSKDEGTVSEESLDKWNGLMDIFESVKRDEQVSSKTVTQFLQNNYDTFISKKLSSITKNDLLKNYTEQFQIDDPKSKYFNELLESAKIYSIISPNIIDSKDINFDTGIKIRIDKLQKLDASQAYPLMLFILKRLKDEVDESITKEIVINAFDYLINFYVRRNVVSKPKSSNIRARIIEIIRDLQSENNDANIMDELEKLSNISVSDVEFEEGAENLRYDSDRTMIRFLLVNLERTHGEYFGKQSKDTLDELKNHVRTWSLEHILPETKDLKKEWCEMIAPEDPKNGAKKVQSEYMHKLGNLTLTGYNSEMSDKSFVEKRDYPPESEKYEGLRTNLYINSSIAGEDEKIDEKESWTKEDINRRTKKLSEQIVCDYQILNIDTNKWQTFVKNLKFSDRSVRKFAEENQTIPKVIVEKLKKEKYI